MTSTLVPLTPEPTTFAQKYLAPRFWRSWAWLAAVVGGFLPVLLPDLLNWVLSHAGEVIDFAFPTLDPLTKVLVLKCVVAAVILLRPVKQPSMALPAVPVLEVNVPPTIDLKGFDPAALDKDSFALDPVSVMDPAENFLRNFRDPKP